jgi:hypothetical protein
MLTNRTQLATKTKSSEHVYQCDPQTPLEEVCEALSTMKSYAYGRLKEMQEQAKTNQEAVQESVPKAE